MKKPSYRDAIYWLARNDENGWLVPGKPGRITVAAAMVRDLWGVSGEKLESDIRCMLRKQGSDVRFALRKPS